MGPARISLQATLKLRDQKQVMNKEREGELVSAHPFRNPSPVVVLV